MPELKDVMMDEASPAISQGRDHYRMQPAGSRDRSQREYLASSASSTSPHVDVALGRLRDHLLGNTPAPSTAKPPTKAQNKPKSQPKSKTAQVKPTVRQFVRWLKARDSKFLGVMDGCTLHAQPGRMVALVPTQVPEGAGVEIKAFSRASVACMIGQARDIFKYYPKSGQWQYLGTYEVTQVEVLHVKDASLLDPPDTTDLRSRMVQLSTRRDQRETMHSLLDDGSVGIQGVALIFTGFNENLVRITQLDSAGSANKNGKKKKAQTKAQMKLSDLAKRRTEKAKANLKKDARKAKARKVKPEESL